MRLKKIHPSSVEKVSPGRAIYHYNMSEDEWAQLQRDFDKSEFVEYSNCINSIKNLSY
jgi:hypothetical protein